MANLIKRVKNPTIQFKKFQTNSEKITNFVMAVLLHLTTSKALYRSISCWIFIAYASEKYWYWSLEIHLSTWSYFQSISLDHYLVFLSICLSVISQTHWEMVYILDRGAYIILGNPRSKVKVTTKVELSVCSRTSPRTFALLTSYLDGWCICYSL